MPRLTRTVTCDERALIALRRPRDGLVEEAAAGDDRFVAVSGPFPSYERRLDLGAVRAEGDCEVTETIDYQLVAPYWRPLVAIPVRRALRRGPVGSGGRQPWWAPPVRLSPDQVVALCRLAMLAVCSGYLGTLLSQTNAFAVREFGVSKTAQAAALATTRAGIAVALVAAFAADRIGRRRCLIGAMAAATVASTTTAAAGGIVAFAATQIVARGLTTGADVVRAVATAEEMPAGARAYAISVTAMSAGLGSGVVVWLLPVADARPWSWRLLFALSLGLLPIVLRCGRGLHEPGRFVAHRAETALPRLGEHRGRLVLLAASALLTTLFVAPASQLQNTYLTDQRGFSGARITLFTLVTSTPAGLGVFFGGRLADVYGRRRIGAIGLAGGVAATVVSFFAAGWALWVSALAGTMVGALVVPALVVYGPELFPTRLRGRANGIITLFAVVGSSAGLLLVGWLAQRWDRFGPPFAVVALGPAIVAVLVVTRYPETAGRELEELNPADGVHPSAGAAG